MKMVSPSPAFFTSRQVATRYSISIRTIDRWMADPKVGFPAPDLVVRSNRFWSETSLVAFERDAAKFARRTDRPSHSPINADGPEA